MVLANYCNGLLWDGAQAWPERGCGGSGGMELAALLSCPGVQGLHHLTMPIRNVDTCEVVAVESLE